ncbi:MAG: EAL domain-containing protein [Pseudomonadota bacterium]
MNLINFFNSGFTFQNYDSELRLKYQFFNSLLAINITIVTFAALIRFYQGEYFQAIIDIVYSCIALFTIFLSRKSQNLFPSLIKFITLFSLIIVSLTFINITNSHIGIGWFYVLILIVFFLSDKKFSFFILFLSILIILTTEYFRTNSHDFKQVILGLFPFVIFTIFISLYEKRNRIQKELLKEQNRLLETYSFEVENYDLITRLPNRKLFMERLNKRASAYQKFHKEFSIILIDIDNFKDINDSWGHLFGDKVLLKISKRLENVLWDQESLSKIGADEFIVMVEETSSDELIKLCNKVKQALKTKLIIDKKKVFVTISFGIARFPKDANNAHLLIQNVDSALHKAKTSGKNCFKFYDPLLTELTNEKLSLLTQLKDAILKDEFEVYYQPQINAQNNTLIGMEALVRWIHPSKGIIPPIKFISIAEEHGLIDSIDYFVMKSAMKTFLQWKQSYPDIGRLSLNLSIKLLDDHSYIKNLQKILTELNFSPLWLELEVTENLIMKNPDIAVTLLNEIHNLGIDIAIDDFGTGYSSLTYLQKLPVDKLKIDRSFIVNLPEKDADLARSIINLSQSLGLSVIAEGIETKEQKEFLLQNDCFYQQGYFYSRPINSEEMLKFIQTYHQ